MNHTARLDLRRNPKIASERCSDARITIIRWLMIAAIAGIVVSAIVAESRLTPQLRQELFKATYVYP